MSSVIKILLFTIIFYYFFKWLGSMFKPQQKQNNNNDSGVRIFKTGNVEKPKVQIKDAETVDFEELDKD